MSITLHVEKIFYNPLKFCLLVYVFVKFIFCHCCYCALGSLYVYVVNVCMLQTTSFWQRAAAADRHVYSNAMYWFGALLTKHKPAAGAPKLFDTYGRK